MSSVVFAFVCFLFFTQGPANTDHANNIISFGEIVWAQDKAPSTASSYSDAGNLHNRGVLAQEQGRFADAESAFRDALRAWDAQPTAPPEAIAGTLNGLGNLLRLEGRYPESGRLLQRAISIEEKAGAPARLDLAFSLNSLGALYCNIREPARATPLLERGLELRQQILGFDDPIISSSLDNLADVLIQRHRVDQAEALYQRSIRILEIHSDPGLLAITLSKLGDLHFRILRDPIRAEALYRQALDAWKLASEYDHPLIGLTLTRLAEVYVAQRRYSDAEPLLKEALQIQEKALGQTHPQVAKVLLDYASLLRKQRRRHEAASIQKRANNIKKMGSNEEQNINTIDITSLKSRR